MKLLLFTLADQDLGNRKSIIPKLWGTAIKCLHKEMNSYYP